MTEGEEFIADFLRSENIEFEFQKKITTLSGDSKGFRIADFYLPKYKVYIEFNGQWNSDNHKNRYKEKTKIYKENNIPCVYLYPENLGIIEYIFHKRLVDVLKKYNLKKELFKYRLSEIWKRCFDNFLFLSFGFILLFYIYPFNFEKNKSEIILLLIIIIFQVLKLSKQIIQIIKYGPKNKRIYF